MLERLGPVHQPRAHDAPIPGVHWFAGCDPDGPRVDPLTCRCEGCGQVACPFCGRSECDDHDLPTRMLVVYYDVSALDERELDALELEAVVQAERSRGDFAHPDVAVTSRVYPIDLAG